MQGYPMPFKLKAACVPNATAWRTTGRRRRRAARAWQVGDHSDKFCIILRGFVEAGVPTDEAPAGKSTAGDCSGTSG